MRIISGNFKGKKILLPKDDLTRPLKDLTKESIFNLIKHSKLLQIQIQDTNILDLFSGVGSFGLECLSRNASSVTFLENYESVLSILKRNIHSLKAEKNTEIIEKNIFDKNTLQSLNKEFEIIFMDPPYKEKKISDLLCMIHELKLLKDNGIIIIHRHKKEQDKFPNIFNTILEKNYGISKIIFGNMI
jgi:16S rRNA (guanine966-N2)-methyltransferase|tara:strand:- start:234 stop:797 length:564 start_codon:yes stop_codon:yes gene_type:complete